MARAIRASTSTRSSAVSCGSWAAAAATSRTGRPTPSGARLQRRLQRRPLRRSSVSRAPLPESRSHEGRRPAHRGEHDGELRHEHELAVLRRRVHDVVPDPDGRARGPELRLGRRRDGRPDRGRARNRPPLEHRLGNFWHDLYRSLVYILLPLAVVLAVLLIWQGVPQTFHGHATATTLAGRASDDRARPCRVADRDQAARDERRRLLQLELRSAVREPERLDQLPRDAVDPADPGRSGLHVRPAGPRPAPCLDGLHLDVRRVRDRHRRQPARGAARIAVLRNSGSTCPGPRAVGRQHGRQGGPLRPGGTSIWTVATSDAPTARSTAASTPRLRPEVQSRS